MPKSYSNESLYLLADRLLPNDPSLQAEVKLAVEQPNSYIKKLPWDALIKGLEERGYLRVFDWKETEDDTVRWIDDLVQKRLGINQPDRWDEIKEHYSNFSYPILYAVAERFPEWEWLNQIDWWHWEDSTKVFLKEIGSHLQQRGLSLAYLASYSNLSLPYLTLGAYPVVVIKGEDLEDIQSLNDKIVYGKVIILA